MDEHEKQAIRDFRHELERVFDLSASPFGGMHRGWTGLAEHVRVMLLRARADGMREAHENALREQYTRGHCESCQEAVNAMRSRAFLCLGCGGEIDTDDAHEPRVVRHDERHGSFLGTPPTTVTGGSQVATFQDLRLSVPSNSPPVQGADSRADAHPDTRADRGAHRG